MRARLEHPVSAFLILGALLVVAIAFGLTFGAVGLSETSRAILLDLRLPRVLLAAFVGATLAVSGLTFQTLLRNPLADPFILGISGGAASGAAIATTLRFSRVPGVVAAAAFAGALGATAAVFLLARRRDHTDPARLLLSGLVLNALFSAVILIAFALTPGGDLAAAVLWMMGTLGRATWSSVAFVAVFFAAMLAVLVWLANDLRMLVFGDEDARSRGVEVERVRLAGFAVASIATGAAVSVTGIIGFVGLLVPHLIRLVWRRDFRLLLPLCMLGGAILLVFADALARTAIENAELPVAAFTAVLGVPFFLSLLRRGR